MKSLLLLATSLSVASIHAADPPTKRTGGFFRFGAQKTEQISAGLFPEKGYEAAASNSSVTPSSAPAGGGSDIFRMGQPQPVDAVSYVIQNGRKVERPIEAATPAAETAAAPAMQSPAEHTGVELASDEGRKRGGLFAFGRRGDDAEENEVVTPVPLENAFAPPRAMPASPAPLVAAPAKPVAAPVKPVAAPVKPVAAPAKPVAAPAKPVETADTPNFALVKEEKEEKSGWLPFLSRKKQDPAPAPATGATAPTTVIAAAEPVTAPAKPATTTEATTADPAASTTAAASPPTTTFEVPRDESKKEEKKEVKPGASGGGILSPIAKIRVPRKELDFSSAETIIQNGEIVAGAETNFEIDSAPGTAGEPQAPQIVNGVKTYSSWDDINVKSSSAAEKIIGSMR